jgi:hypothetical protein
MGKKPQRHTWGEAKRLCRLNQNDIKMAKNLGFGPDGLIRSRPDPKQKWKLSVKDWIRELHSERFGCVLEEKPEPAPGPTTPVDDEEAARRYEEELYWEDYRERNRDYQPAKHQPGKPAPAASAPATVTANDSWIDEIMDEDAPSKTGPM